MKLYELAIGLQINQRKNKVITESNKRSPDKKKSELGSKQKRS